MVKFYNHGVVQAVTLAYLTTDEFLVYHTHMRELCAIVKFPV